jgi:hypothetical protein
MPRAKIQSFDILARGPRDFGAKVGEQVSRHD